MKSKSLIIVAVLFLLLPNLHAQGFEHFVTAEGNKLMNGKEQFRFISFNIPTLNFVEDEMDFRTVYPYKLPTEYEIRDVLESVKQMGGEVVRIYTLPVKYPDFPDSVATHITGPGEFNEEAFKVNDMMLKIANELEIRIIFSLLNNWDWMGGAPQYAAFRDKTWDDFWTDPQLIADFKKTIEFTLNRTNTLTGIPYKEDKSIMCWETGNELVCPHEWTAEIAAYIKSIDKNHLLLDGYHAMDERFVREASVADPNIDLIHTHHYALDPDVIYGHIQKNIEIIDGRKPYILGEFGFQSTRAMDILIDKIIATEEISGALIWGLRGHREQGGFYWHSEPHGQGIYKAYRWPGFSSGTLYDEANFLEMYRTKIYKMRNMEVPEIEIPNAPELLPINEVYSISWKGATGANSYHVERAEKSSGPWTRIAHHVSDAQHAYFPLYNDYSAKIGKTYFYRIVAVNSAGSSPASNIVGPITVKDNAIVDNMENIGQQYFSKDLELTTGNDRKYKENIHRFKGKKGSELIYRTAKDFKKFRIYSFEKTDEIGLSIWVSENGKDYKKVKTKVNDYQEKESKYDYLHPLYYHGKIEAQEDIHYLKVWFEGEAELVRAELIFN